MHNNGQPGPAREAWKRFSGSLLLRVVVLLLILYIIYHCAMAAMPRMTTAVVREAQEALLTSGEATVFRDETVLYAAGGGLLLSYPLENGAKVHANSAVVTVCTAAADAETLALLQQELSWLDAMIVASRRAERQYSYSTEALGSASLAAIHEDIRSHLLLLAAQEASPSTQAAARAELLISLTAYASLTGASSSSVTPTEALEAQRAALLSSVVRTSRLLTLPELTAAGVLGEQLSAGGYFYHASAVDGYESLCSPTALQAMNITDYDALMAAAPQQTPAGMTAVGKLVNGYAWSITLPVAFELTETLSVGETYPVTFPDENNVRVSMTLDRIIRSVGDGRAVLVLRASEMPEGFRYIRHQTAQLTLAEPQGYRIPDTALHRQGEQTFVYILKDGSVRRRDVEVLLQGEGYVLIAVPGEEQTDGISANDVVITSGEDLYDGKYIH